MKPLSYLPTIVAIGLLPLLFSCSGTKKGNYDTIVLQSNIPAATAASVKPETGVSKNGKLQTKYAAYLHTSPDSITNMRLYSFIDNWLNTPYLWGGTTKAGIDCSAFMQRLLGEVYDINIPRTSIQQFFTNSVEPFGSRHYLKEGDLGFFYTSNDDKLISHVGLYLGNRMFVNASSSYGVSIADMDTPYWKSRYVAAGRVIVKKKKR